MDKWEFLLQQEGDRTWLPLESSTAEILEGRYRVMAHSSYANTAVEVRISHILPDQMPPKRRVNKRHHRTNTEGLIVVMPFTHLKPGSWELRCIGGDLMEDILGEGWQYSVQLQVLPPSVEGDPNDDWNDQDSLDLTVVPKPLSDIPVNSPTRTTAPQADTDIGTAIPLTASAPVEPLPPTQPETVYLQLQQSAYVLPSGRSFTLIGQFQHPFSETDSPPNHDVDESPLSLDLHVYLRDPQTAELIKQIQHPLTNDVDQTFEVEVCLPDALNTRLVLGEVIIQSSLENQQSHIWATQAFTVTIALNELLDVIADQAEAQDKSDTESINVPLLPTESADSVFLPVSSRKPQDKPADLTLPGGKLPSLRAQSSLLPALGWMMPPQIYQADLDDAAPKSLALPPLSSKVISAASPAPAEAQPPVANTPAHDTQDKHGQPPVILELPSFAHSPRSPQLSQTESPQPQSAQPNQPNPDTNWISSQDLALNEIDSLEVGEAPGVTTPVLPAVATPVFRSVDDDLDAALVAQEADAYQWDAPSLDRAFALMDEAALIEPEQPANGEPYLDEAYLAEANLTDESDAALDPSLAITSEPQAENKAQVESSFQSLNLQTRFWDRLNAFAVEGYQAAHELRSAIAASEVVIPTEHPSAANPIPPGSASPIPPDAPKAQADLETQEVGFADEVVIYEDSPAIAPATGLMADVERLSSSARDDDWIIPQPEIFLPDGDFKAGQQLPIRIVLPDSDQRLYVKLWVSDRQTRTLVDEPRWLMYLEPNGQGSVETTLRITVPMHCLEIQIAAIAVDMLTQRESERVVCERRVVPMDLPSLSLDEFDV